MSDNKTIYDKRNIIDIKAIETDVSDMQYKGVTSVIKMYNKLDNSIKNLSQISENMEKCSDKKTFDKNYIANLIAKQKDLYFNLYSIIETFDDSQRDDFNLELGCRFIGAYCIKNKIDYVNIKTIEICYLYEFVMFYTRDYETYIIHSEEEKNKEVEKRQIEELLGDVYVSREKKKLEGYVKTYQYISLVIDTIRKLSGNNIKTMLELLSYSCDMLIDNTPKNNNEKELNNILYIDYEMLNRLLEQDKNELDRIRENDSFTIFSTIIKPCVSSIELPSQEYMFPRVMFENGIKTIENLETYYNTLSILKNEKSWLN